MRVSRLRLLLLRHPGVAASLFACALLLKILVPAGYMPMFAGGNIALQLCGGTVPVPAAKPAAMPGMAHHTAMADHHPAPATHAETGRHDSPDHSGDHADKQMPCAFAGLSLPSLAAVDAALLAVAIAFILAAVFRRVSSPVLRARPHLRPFLRGPPVQQG